MKPMMDPADAALGLEAAEWLLRLDATDPEGAAEYPDANARNQAFFDWISQSPDHLRVFLETLETQRRLSSIDANHLIAIEDLLKERFADVIPLRRVVKEARPQRKSPDFKSPPLWRRWGIAAAVLLAALAGGGYWWIETTGSYATGIGEQRTAKLADGSFIYLNTDSKVEVDFSDKARDVRLLRGEALFVVERDSARPFTVTAGNTQVRALGTQFDVRRRAQGAEVAVVEGAVQVASLGEPRKLVAGEQAEVDQGRIAPRARQSVADAVAWRQRRLVFHDARLQAVAEEFNRYNRTQIHIEGEAARDIRLSGIFDADRPQALILYAAKNDALKIEPDGRDWVIQGR